MELTGKCLEDFGRWVYKNKDIPFTLDRDRDVFSKEYNEWLFNFPESMKYGVYEDFFDSVGVVINIDPVLSFKNEIDFFWVFINDDLLFDNGNDEFKTRPEARIKAIEKASNIYNELNSTEL